MENILEFLTGFFNGTASCGEQNLIAIIKKMSPDDMYLDLTNPQNDLDNIYVRSFNTSEGKWEDMRVLAIRVVKNEKNEDELQIAVVLYEKELGMNKDELHECSLPNSDCWVSVHDDSIEYVHTMFDIISGIELYIPEEYLPKEYDGETMMKAAAGDVEDPDAPDKLDDFVVVCVDNPMNGNKYELLVRTNRKDKVIEELYYGLFFEDNSDNMWAKVDDKIYEETLTVMGSHCIDLTKGEVWEDKVINGILSSQKKSDLDKYLLKRFNMTSFMELSFGVPIELSNGVVAKKWVADKTCGGIVTVWDESLKQDVEEKVSNLSTEDKLLIFKRLI